MLTSYLGVAFAVVAAVFAQITQIPTCANSCVTQFTSGDSIGGCPQLSVSCICSNKDFLNNIACCLATSCNTADQAQAVLYAQSLCKTAGVTVPDSVVCVSSSTGAGTSSATSLPASNSTGSTGSTAAATTTPPPTSASTSAAAPASTSSKAAAGVPNSPATGMGIAGGIFAALAYLL